MDLKSNFKKYTKNLPFNTFNYSVNISLLKKYIYVETPKVGCSSIKATLQRLEIGDPNLERPLHLVHKREYSPLLKPTQVGNFDELLLNPAFYKFCFVRNPYTRVLSAYLNKIRFSRDGFNSSRRNLLFAQLGLNLRNKKIKEKEISFNTFVKAIIKQPIEFMDPHWRIQYYQTFQDSIEYDFIGKFENFDKDLLKVLQKIGGKDVDKYVLEVSGHKTNASDKIKEFYTEEIRDWVYTKYIKDFDFFGYTSILPQISNEKAKFLSNQSKEKLLTKEEISDIIKKSDSENLEYRGKFPSLISDPLRNFFKGK